MTPLLVAVGAGAGAAFRGWLAARLDRDRWPWGIWSANVVGSTLLGLLVGGDVDTHALALVGTGFCGAFTTYSTFAAQVLEREPRQGATYAVATVALALIGCGVGFAAGQAI